MSKLLYNSDIYIQTNKLVSTEIHSLYLYNLPNEKHHYRFLLDACSCRSNSPISESTGKSSSGQCTFGKFCITAESPF